MRVEKLILFVFVLILLVGVVSANMCQVVREEDASYTEIMRLSDLTNAHGELVGQGNYDYVLECDFGQGDISCGTGNRILLLSSETNAHAEVPWPEPNDYSNIICYEGIICTSGTESYCLAGGYDIEMLSISSLTNAHIGRYSDYNTKICCKERITIPDDCGDGTCDEGEECLEDSNDCEHRTCYAPGQCTNGCTYTPLDEGETGIGCEYPSSCDGNGVCIPPTPVAFWASVGNPNVRINEPNIDVIIGATQILLVLKNGIPEEMVTFEVFERDASIFDFVDDSIFGPTTQTVGTDGTASVTWTITAENLAKGYGGFLAEDNSLEDLDEFYFSVGSLRSDTPDVTMNFEPGEDECLGITSCEYYDAEGETACDSDNCNAWVEEVRTAVNVLYGEEHTCLPGESIISSGDYEGCEIINCQCEWDSGASECQSRFSLDCDDDDDDPHPIGTCTIISSTPEECSSSNEFIEITYNNNFIWDEDNEYGATCPAGDPDYLVDEGQCRYDPNGQAASCERVVTTTLPCPEQVKLPFFGVFGFITSLILISLIYVGLMFKKRV